MPETNGEKTVLYWVVRILVLMLIGLLGTVWAISQGQISDNKDCIDKNRSEIESVRKEEIVPIKEFIARQDEINKKMDEILRELRK